MELFGDKVLVRFTKENRDSIFSKEITMSDGSKTRLFLSIDAEDVDERKSKLFVQTGIIEAVAPDVENILVGDIAIVDYMLCNDESKLVWKEENGDTVYWATANTTYHVFDEVVYANRRTKHDTVVAKRGDIDNLSSIYGIIRGEILLARSPFVFLQHQDSVVKKTTEMKIVYNDVQKSFERTIIACDSRTSKKYGMALGDNVLVLDVDVFSLKLEDRKVDCIMDMDVIGRKKHLAV